MKWLACTSSQFGRADICCSESPPLHANTAIYLGEVVTQSGERQELQLKGAGLTPFSRSADGRKVLRSSMREFLASEAMDALVSVCVWGGGGAGHARTRRGSADGPRCYAAA